MTGDFWIGEWLVQPSLGRVSTGERTVRLRPQLMDVLTCLADRAGQVVSKDALLAAVWPDQFVAESGLARCIAELRQALGDDAHQPRIIETIPKRGYRLRAPVTMSSDTARDAGSGPRAAPVGPALDEAPPDGRGPSGDASAPSAGPAPRRGGAWRYGSTVAAAMLVGALGLLWWRWPRPPLLGSEDAILVTDFANGTGDAVFDGTLTQALVIQLEQSPFLRVVPRERAREALRRMGRSADEPMTPELAREVCERENAAAFLSGSIVRFGQDYVVGLEATACRTGVSLAQDQAQVAGKERVLETIGEMARRMRERLGESMSTVERFDVPIVQATTGSLEALRAFSLAEALRARADDRREWDGVVALFQRAIELDPDFALAYARLGTTLRNLGRVDEALPIYQEAYERRDRVTEPERLYIVAFYQNVVMGEPAKASQTFELWKQTYPQAWIPRYNLSVDAVHAGRFEAALEDVTAVIRLSPTPSAFSVRAYALAALGRFDEADAALEEAIARDMDRADLRFQLFEVAFCRDDQVKMDRELARAAASDLSLEASLLSAAAGAEYVRGRRSRGTALYRRAEAAARQHGTLPAVADLVLDHAWYEALLGYAREAGAGVERAVGIDRSRATLISAITVASALGAVDRAASFLAEVEKTPRPTPGFVWEEDALVPIARVALALHSGRQEDALVGIRSIGGYELSPTLRLVPIYLRGLAHLAAGQPAAAARAFERLLQHEGMACTSPLRTLAWLWLARARAGSGDVQSSRDAYARFHEIWKDADAEIPLLREATREYEALR